MEFKEVVGHHYMLLFFYLLLVATFITVAVYVYGGEQQELGTRNFGNVDIRKNITIGGTTRRDYDLVGITKNQTLSLDPNQPKLFGIGGSSDVTEIALPSAKNVVDMFPNPQNGDTFHFGSIYSQKAGVTLDIPAKANGSGYSAIDTNLVGTITLAHGPPARVYNLSFTYEKGDLIWWDTRSV
jgi:hypothetical protein